MDEILDITLLVAATFERLGIPYVAVRTGVVGWPYPDKKFNSLRPLHAGVGRVRRLLYDASRREPRSSCSMRSAKNILSND